MMKYDSQLFSFYCSGVEAMVNMTKVWLEGAERLRAHQLKSINDALSEVADTEKQIKSAKTFEELIEIQARLMPGRMGQAMGYWGGLCAGTARNNMDIARQAQHEVSDIANACRTTLEATPAAADPIMAPLKSAVTALCSAYTYTARAAEEAGRTSHAEVASTGRHMSSTETRRKAAAA